MGGRDPPGGSPPLATHHVDFGNHVDAGDVDVHPHADGRTCGERRPLPAAALRPGGERGRGSGVVGAGSAVRERQQPRRERGGGGAPGGKPGQGDSPPKSGRRRMS